MIVEKRGVSLAIFFVGLASCVSNEYLTEEASCSSLWMRKIPPVYEQEIYEKLESRQVPTGQITCTTIGYSTNCNQIMRTDFYYVPAVRTVDRNAFRRDPEIAACAQKACEKKFGNPECKVDG